MFKGLKTLTMWMLGITCLVFALGLLIFTLWWFSLPLMNIFIIICVIAAFAILFFSARRLKVWLNKRNYVKQVLTLNPISHKITAENHNPMLQAWHKGIEVFTHSLAHFGNAKRMNPIYRQSWVLMLGRNSLSNQSLIHNLTSSSTAKRNSADPLRWHFLPDLVLLEADDSLLNTHDPLAQSQWEEFLVQIVNDRTKEPLNSLVITINAKDIYSNSSEDENETIHNYREKTELDAVQVADLREYGNLLRSRISQVLAIFAARIPVYILVNGIDELHGMKTLPHQLPDVIRKKLLGKCFDVTPNQNTEESKHLQENNTHTVHNLVRQSISSATNDIRSFINKEAAQGNFPENDSLYAPMLFQYLEEGLCVFLESLMRPTPHGLSPLLRCIAFTCSGNEQELRSTLPNSVSGTAFTDKMNPVSTLPASHSHILNPLPSNIASGTLPPHILSKASPNMPSLDSLQNAAYNGNNQKLENAASDSQKKPKFTSFISDLFTHILPDDRLLYQPQYKTGLREAWIFPAFVGYYLLLFTFCGMLAINTIYTTQTLEGITTIADVDSAIVPLPDRIKPLQESYDRINYLDQAQDNWFFPFTGQNRMALEQRKEENNFVSIMRTSILPNILQDITNNSIHAENSTGLMYAENRENNTLPAFENLKRITWMQEAINLRIVEETSRSMREKPFPFTQYSSSNQDLWSIGFGELFLHFVDLSSVESLSSLQPYLKSAVQNTFDNNGKSLFAEMENIINAEIPAASIPISHFWPAIPSGSPYFTSIPPVYTAEGFNRMQSMLSKIWELNHLSENKLEDNPYWQEYIIHYGRAWEDFANYTDFAWIDITRISTLKDMLEISKSNQNPYIRILSSMAKNLEPIRKTPVTPQWIEEIFLINAITKLANLTTQSETKSFLTTPNILMNALKSSPKDMDLLRKLMEEHDPATIIDTVNSLAIYFNTLNNIHTTLNNKDGSFELARVQFGGNLYGNLEESDFTIAQNSLLNVLSILNISTSSKDGMVHKTLIDYDSNSPAGSLIHGPYRFLAHAMTYTASQKLQEIWKSSITPNTMALPDENSLQTLFNEEGIITAFLSTEAAPFLNRQPNHYEATTFAGNTFPFATAFLDFIQQGQENKKRKQTQSYNVNITSQTSSSNPDAGEFLQYFELSLVCQDKTYTLRNSNYPESAMFTYAPKLCSKATLDLHFPSLHLQYTYNDFAEFLNEFSSGVREFNGYDFPEQANAMKKLNINKIRIRMLPENSSKIINSINTVLVPFPTRICEVW